MKKTGRIPGWIKLVIIIYCLVGSALYYLQDKLLLRPLALAAGETYHFTQPFTETDIYLDEATRINIVRFSVPADSAKGVVLYFHGNRENINHYAQYSKMFTDQKYEVWMPDYPGYGKSTGDISEKTLYDLALQVYKLARTKYDPSRIIIYGKSLGTGIAAELASVRDCRRLILETPYYSLTSLVRIPFFIYPVGWLLKYKIPTYSFLQKVTAPVTAFYGTRDWTVPPFNTRRLQNVFKQGDEMVRIDGGGHNNLPSFPLFRAKLDSVLQR